MTADPDPIPHRPAPPGGPAGSPSPGGAPAVPSGTDPPRDAADPSLGEAARALGRALRRRGARAIRGARAGLAGGVSAAGAGMRAMGARRGAAPVAETAAPVGSARPAPAASNVPVAEGRVRRRRVRAPGARAIRFGWRLFVWSVFLLALGAAGTGLAVWLLMRDLPLADMLPPIEEPTIRIETVDAQILTTQGAYRAPYVALEEFPPHLIEAVLAIEDRRFFEHAGVDFRGIARALYRNASAGGVVEGGSTITQQLVKILYLDPERTISRKLQEAVLATTLERQLGKERILELYLNSVYLGSGAYGMPAAAETYYGKDVAELTLPEAALLAASIQLPSQVNPIADLGAVQNRGALVLSLMADQDRIEEAARDQALAELARLAPEPPPTRAGSYFADWVLEEIEALQGASSEALTATATIDPQLQVATERIVREVMAEEGAAAGATQAAVVVMTGNGRVRAMVGGLDYSESEFNRATEALRQPGSTFKIFVYMAALVRGASPDNTISDEPIEIGDWRPENFDGRSHGTVTLREAFARSYNQAAVRLAQTVGIEDVISVARRFGIEAELQATPSLALGTSEVTLLDMTEAFAAMALGRTPVNATGIEVLHFGESGGSLGVSGVNDREQTRLTRTREPMLEMLRAVVEEGTARAARIEGRDIVGKTGTSQDSRDAWFIGFVVGPRITIGVWVGNDDNSPMDSVTGGGIPAEIFRRVMIEALGGGGGGQQQAQEGEQRAQAEVQPVSCDIRACSAAYRSFRAEDCTYQPFEGPRRVCTR